MTRTLPLSTTALPYLYFTVNLRSFGAFAEVAEEIDERHLLGRAAADLQEPWRAYQHAQTLRA